MSARLARQWKASGESGEVTRILRELQQIRLGHLRVGSGPGTVVLARLSEVPAHLNALLGKLKLLPLFAAPPAWAHPADPAQP